MNKYIMIVAILAASVTFSGCSVWDLKYGKEKPKITYSYLIQEGKTNGLHAWNPDTSAAVNTIAPFLPATSLRTRNRHRAAKAHRHVPMPLRMADFVDRNYDRNIFV